MDEPVKLRLFEDAMLPHLRAAHNLARWIVKSPQDAEDLVQEAYIKAFRYFDGFQGGNSQAWLLAIVRNTCLTWLRDSRTGLSSVVSFDEHIHRTGEHVRNVEEALVVESDIGSLRDCIEGLPVEYRETVVMRELEGMSYKEIAKTMSVPAGTIMSRLSRGRKRLEDCMGSRA